MAWRELVIKNFWWKLLSLILAALMWLTIRKDIQPAAGSTITRRFETVPVEVRRAAANTNVYQIFPENVVIEMDGPTEFLNQLEPKSVKAYIDLTGLTTEKKAKKQIQVEPVGGALSDVKLSVKPAYAEVERQGG